MELKVKDTDKIKIQTPQDTYEIMKKIFFDRHKKVDILKEHFWTIALNMGLRILSIELVSMGTNTQPLVGAQEVFRVPLYKISQPAGTCTQPSLGGPRAQRA